MLTFVLASMMVAASDPAPVEAASMKNQPTRYCREIGSASSYSEAIRICRTRAQWLEREACNGATRYCPPKARPAVVTSGIATRETAFPLDEDARITCRIVKMTGSRLRSAKLCLAQREWDRMYNDAREEVGELQDNQSKQPRSQ